MTTRKVHWGLKKGIIDFEGSLSETRWGVRKINPIREYREISILYDVRGNH